MELGEIEITVGGQLIKLPVRRELLQYHLLGKITTIELLSVAIAEAPAWLEVKQTEMKLVFAQNYDDFLSAGRGAILPVFREAGDSRILTHYIRRCPGCDRQSAIPINDANGKDYGFGVEEYPFNVESLTLLGVLHCPDCGWRGYLHKGQYIEERS